MYPITNILLELHFISAVYSLYFFTTTKKRTVHMLFNSQVVIMRSSMLWKEGEKKI
jgi:hypothetical protein